MSSLLSRSMIKKTNACVYAVIVTTLDVSAQNSLETAKNKLIPRSIDIMLRYLIFQFNAVKDLRKLSFSLHNNASSILIPDSPTALAALPHSLLPRLPYHFSSVTGNALNSLEPMKLRSG